MQDASRACELARLRGELERRVVDVETGGAMRQLRQMLVRLAKGEVAMRVEIWRTGVKVAAYARYEAMHAALEAQMMAQGQGAGLRQLRQIMIRMASCLLYTSPSPRDQRGSRMPSSA